MSNKNKNTEGKVKKEKKPTGRPRKYTKEYVEKVAKELDKWSKGERALFLEGFMEHHKDNIQDDHFFDWKKENEIFRETLAKVKKRLINRLRVKACYREMDGGFVAKVLPLVDLAYRKWCQEEKKLVSESQDKKIEVIVKNAEK